MPKQVQSEAYLKRLMRRPELKDAAPVPEEWDEPVGESVLIVNDEEKHEQQQETER